MQRREILRTGTGALATATAFGLAGCGGDGSDGADGDGDDDEDDGGDDTGNETDGSGPGDQDIAGGTCQPPSGDLEDVFPTVEGYTLATTESGDTSESEATAAASAVYQQDGSDAAASYTIAEFPSGDAARTAIQEDVQRRSGVATGYVVVDAYVFLVVGEDRETVRTVLGETQSLQGCVEGNVQFLEASSGSDDEETVERDSGEQVASRLQVVSAVGNVADEQVTDVELTVKLAPGSDPVDLQNVSVSWVESGGTFTLIHDGVSSRGIEQDGRFHVSAFRDDSDSAPELDDADDRFKMVFDLGTSTRGDVDWGQPASEYTFGSPLEEGDIATLNLNTRSGSSTNVRLVVPQSLSGSEAVNL